MGSEEDYQKLEEDMRPKKKRGDRQLYIGKMFDFLSDPDKYNTTAPKRKKPYKNTKDGIHQHIEETEEFINKIWLRENNNHYPVDPDTLLSFLYNLNKNKTNLPLDTRYGPGKPITESTYKSYFSRINNAYRDFYNYEYKELEGNNDE